MRTLDSMEYEMSLDNEGGLLLENLRVTNCRFDNCSYSLSGNPKRRSVFKNIEAINCESIGCIVGSAVLDEVTIDGLNTDDFLMLWSPLLRHVTLKGRIGKAKINNMAFLRKKDDRVQAQFATDKDHFYKNVDWALDISQGLFSEFYIEGVPTNLIRRDPSTQLMVSRERALTQDWRSKLDFEDSYWIDFRLIRLKRTWFYESHRFSV